MSAAAEFSNFKQEVIDKASRLGLQRDDTAMAHLWKRVSLACAPACAEVTDQVQQQEDLLVKSLAKHTDIAHARILVQWLREKLSLLLEQPELLAPSEAPSLQRKEEAMVSESSSEESTASDEWVKLCSGAGRTYFWGRRSQACVWALPEGVAAKWIGVRTDDGRTYFFGADRTPVWVLPKLELVVPAAVEQAAPEELVVHAASDEQSTPSPSSSAASEVVDHAGHEDRTVAGHAASEGPWEGWEDSANEGDGSDTEPPSPGRCEEPISSTSSLVASETCDALDHMKESSFQCTSRGRSPTRSSGASRSTRSPRSCSSSTEVRFCSRSGSVSSMRSTRSESPAEARAETAGCGEVARREEESRAHHFDPSKLKVELELLKQEAGGLHRMLSQARAGQELSRQRAGEQPSGAAVRPAIEPKSQVAQVQEQPSSRRWQRRLRQRPVSADVRTASAALRGISSGKKRRQAGAAKGKWVDQDACKRARTSRTAALGGA